ncbi:4a-hydroxytetrahydrobiopterin dehydratase [Variovorax paradoxus]|uniref:4a-hydroxytetrahydrobiopterin dehydratase n=1 Tax=Variovorax paradoxus TaxID=34073 RepID=UPI00278703D1|nr:4a-hydroxytetrahydrobiopterin dehydratase [Variovorax paradoxus]MDP9962958.1 4a-hydroxytetrahydrobiopterin dehydratase [Variovorax paradoxus]
MKAEFYLLRAGEPALAARLLDPAEVADLLANLPHWTYAGERGGVISRTFGFADFSQAFAFMTQIALAAEKLNHHPEWSNVYGRVDVTLTTHDVSGLSTLDAQMARYAEALFCQYQPH